MNEKPVSTPNAETSTQQNTSFPSFRSRLLHAVIDHPARTTLILAAVTLLVNFGLYLNRCGAASYYGIGFDQVSAHYDSDLYSFALMIVFSAGLVLTNAIGWLIASQSKGWRAILFTALYAAVILVLFFAMFIAFFWVDLGDRASSAISELLGTLGALSVAMTVAGVVPGVAISLSHGFNKSRTAKESDNTAQSEAGDKRTRSFSASLLICAGCAVFSLVAITILILAHGVWTETNRTDYAIWTNETGDTYAVVYRDDSRWCLEHCRIDEEKLTIYTRRQLWKSPLDIEVENERFESVTLKKSKEDETDDQPASGSQDREAGGCERGEFLPTPLPAILVATIAMILYLRIRHDGSPTGDAKHPFLRMVAILVGTLFLTILSSYLVAQFALSILAKIAPEAAIPSFFVLCLAGIVFAALVGCRQMRRASLTAWESLPKEATEGEPVTKGAFVQSLDTFTLVCWVLCQAVSVAAIMIAVGSAVYDTSLPDVQLLLWVGFIYPLAFDAEYASRILKRKGAY